MSGSDDWFWWISVRPSRHSVSTLFAFITTRQPHCEDKTTSDREQGTTTSQRPIAPEHSLLEALPDQLLRRRVRMKPIGQGERFPIFLTIEFPSIQIMDVQIGRESLCDELGDHAAYEGSGGLSWS